MLSHCVSTPHPRSLIFLFVSGFLMVLAPDRIPFQIVHSVAHLPLILMIEVKLVLSESQECNHSAVPPSSYPFLNKIMSK